MTWQIRLDDDARNRYGCAEWLDWDPDRLSVREATVLQEQLGVTWKAWPAFLKGGSVGAVRAVAWFSLTRAGHQVGWDDLDFDLVAFESRRVDAGKAPEGSGSTPPTPSEDVSSS